MIQKNIILDITKTQEGYTAVSPHVEGLVAFSETFEEVIEIAKNLAQELLSLQKKNISETNNISSLSFPEKIFYPTTIII